MNAKNRRGQRVFKEKGLIFVILGPSGSGKTTLLENLLRQKELKRKLLRSISLTTRPRRPGERDKEDYFFVSKKQFQAHRLAEKILEWTRYLGYYYATPKDFVEQQLEQGKSVILSLDLRGACRIKQLYPQKTIAIFVKPPSLNALFERIKNRCSKTEDKEIRQRLSLAKKELLSAHSYDYCLLNQDLESVIKQLKNIILRHIALSTK